MHNGGNAVDGAIAANAVLGVVLPDTCGPGGDLFALIHRPGDETPKALNASGMAGSGANAAVLRDRGFDEVPWRSPWTITVPGCVDGWEELLAREGTKSMVAVLTPAIELATEGFAVSAELSMALERERTLIREQGSSPPLYPSGVTPAAGDILRRPDLAQTLIDVARSGREAFYEGPVGAAMTSVTEGVITAADLEKRQVEWVEPAGTQVFGISGWTISPNSQGYLTLAALWIFEQLQPPKDPTNPEFQHALIEAYRSVAWERDDLVAEPFAAPLSAEELLSPDRLSWRVEAIAQGRTANWPAPRPAPGGTAFLCTRDASGVGVALIQSNFSGIGSGFSAGGTGVFLHDRGAGFNLIEGHANEMLPRKRPLHTLSPSIWTSGAELVAVLGTRGGEYQPQLLAQVGANHFWAGMSAASSLRAPRWLIDSWHSRSPHSVRLEPQHGPAMATSLPSAGHAVELVELWQPQWGPVSLIAADEHGVNAAADPRISTAAATASA